MALPATTPLPHASDVRGPIPTAGVVERSGFNPLGPRVLGEVLPEQAIEALQASFERRGGS